MFPFERQTPRPIGAKDKKMKAAINKTKELSEEMKLRL